LKRILADLLNLKQGLEDILHLIQEQQNGVDVKTLLLGTAQQQILSINNVYKSGLNWLNEISGANDDEFIKIKGSAHN